MIHSPTLALWAHHLALHQLQVPPQASGVAATLLVRLRPACEALLVAQLLDAAEVGLASASKHVGTSTGNNKETVGDRHIYS